MTYKKGTAQSIPDLMDSWVEFATRDHGGWQGYSDELRGHMSLYATNLVASASWFPDDDYGDGTFSMHQAKSFDALADPDGHDGDSGLGRTSEAVVVSDATTEDVGNWTLAGTVPTVTFGQADPDGFSNAYLVDVPGSAAVSQLSETEGITGITVGHDTSVEFYISQPTSGGADITSGGEIIVSLTSGTDTLSFDLQAADLADDITMNTSAAGLSADNVEVVPVGGDWFRVRASGVPSDGTSMTLTLQVVTTSFPSGMEFKLFKPRFYGDPIVVTTATDNPLLDSRCVARPGSGPFDYWFFATGDPTLSEEPLGLYAVIKGANGQYRHFGLGRLNKVGTYEGGEFVYGHMQEEGPGAAALSTSHSMLLDGLYRGDGHGATVRTEDLEAQADDTVLYSQMTQLTSASLEQGSGGFRGGIFSAPWGLVSGQASDVFQPMYPIVAMHRNPDYKMQPTLTPLGAMDGVAGVDITNIDAEARRRVGSETWIFFPAALKTTDDVDGRTNNIGVAYRIDD